MRFRNFAFAAFLIGTGSAHAQFGMSQMMNPMGANMMSGQRYQPQSMMNPYLNPMAASNPYLNPSAGMANPIMMMQPKAPAYGGYGMPAAPAQAASMSFFPMMPATPVATPAPALAPAAAAQKSVAPAPVSTPFDPAMWMQMMGGMAPATSSIPAVPAAAK